MKNFKIEIASVPDREKLVAEIWYKGELIAEINQESENLELDIYCKNSIKIDYDSFCQVLQEAKAELLNN